jgi:hypothetical protein
MKLTRDIYKKGLLVDDELVGGVAEDPDRPDGFIAYVLHHTTREYLGYDRHPDLEKTLKAVNSVHRDWKYEKSSGYGGGDCSTGGCSRKKCDESCPSG